MKNEENYNKKINLFLVGLLGVLFVFFCVQNFNLSLIFEADASESSDNFSKIMLSENIEEDQYEDFLINIRNKKNLYSFTKKEKKFALSIDEDKLKSKIETITYDYPIGKMAPFIAKYDKTVAGLIVGIAKKESNWGKRSPAKKGEVCYNYWGYKGAGSRGTAMGYGCFANQKEAVETIGDRIQELVEQGLNTPAKMIVWKCGRSCAGHNPSGVKKWISDVSLYYNKVVMK